MPRTDTLAANHGQNRSRGRPLRSASSTISMPRVSRVNPLVDGLDVAGTSVAIGCLLEAGAGLAGTVCVPEQDGSDDPPEACSSGRRDADDLVGVHAGGPVFERLDGGDNRQAEDAEAEL